AGTGVLTLEILDGTGRQILNRQVHAGARTEIDLSGRAPGLYLVRLTGENGTTQFSRLILN
ncbi:MAG: T9SS type A sorting domain-containing protein, partial [Lewinellaceae bacterium]|nr:T9SS type A sorting domain-containing protein [Lewinellaceae bacterium]